MRTYKTQFLACLAVVACNPDPDGMGTATEGTESSSSGSTTAVTTMPLDTTADGTTMGSGDASSSSSGTESSSTGPICMLGAEGCLCDEGACDDGLTCVDDVCVVVVLCGNGDLDDREECDDGNGVDSDGCDNDCTISPGAVEVIAGDEHVCARFHTGDIKCWGNFDDGRLGYMEVGQDVGDDETPADMPFVNVGASVEQLALGSDFTCVLVAGDEVVCWGGGQHGRLGQGNQTDLGSDQEPADIPPISLGGTPVQIATGAEHACAVMLGGELRCWGRNDQGQVGLPGFNMVGDDELPSDVPPVNLGKGMVAEQVACGTDHTCVILGGGGVLCFGRDNAGQLGTPESMEVMVGDDEDPGTEMLVLLDSEAVLIHARFNHTCVAYNNGEVQCWGEGGSGRLGYGNVANVGDDEDVLILPALDLGGGDPTHLATGSAHTCVRLATTEIFCWGEGDNGRLGYGNAMDEFAPLAMQVDLSQADGPRMVTVGREFSCATTEGSQVKCWGGNNRGQLGYGLAWTTDLGDDELIDSVGAVMLE
jgi:cysteine-rich repeat protein